LQAHAVHFLFFSLSLVEVFPSLQRGECSHDTRLEREKKKEVSVEMVWKGTGKKKRRKQKPKVRQGKKRKQNNESSRRRTEQKKNKEMNFINSLIEKSRLIADPRTENWPLMDFQQVVLIALCYILVVALELNLRLIPKMELKVVRVVHNFVLTILSAYMCIEMLLQAAKTSFWGPIHRGPEGLGVRASFFFLILCSHIGVVRFFC
jgi:hypothetical protein